MIGEVGADEPSTRSRKAWRGLGDGPNKRYFATCTRRMPHGRIGWQPLASSGHKERMGVQKKMLGRLNGLRVFGD